MLEKCPVKKGGKHHYLRYSAKEMRLARRRQNEKIDQFRDQYRWRAGVEATMSKLDRKTGIKKLRYRGFARVRLAVVLKALAINILRAAAALPTLLFNVIATFILFFKELFQKNVRVWYFCSPEPAWEAFSISEFLRGHQFLITVFSNGNKNV